MGEVWAVIPARGGSKGVPDKNLQAVAGRPLVVRAVDACTGAGSVDKVIVSTDSVDIGQAAAKAGALVVVRPAHLSGDQASSESAVLHVLEYLRETHGQPETVLLVQCTSPFTTSTTIDRLVAMVVDFDAAFTAVRSHRFLWGIDQMGQAVGINHDASVRLPRQALAPQFLENGAAYAMRAAGFIEAGHRFFGRVGVCLDDEGQELEVDSPADLAHAQAMMLLRSAVSPSVDRLRSVTAVVFDFDGVLTDDKVIVREDGTESIIAHRGDGLGIAQLKAAGFHVLILSTETNPVVAARGRKLGVEVLQGRKDKLASLVQWCGSRDLKLEDCLFIGNDVNDLSCLEAVGLSACPADAHHTVRATVEWVLDHRGGHGAAREACDALLDSQTELVGGPRSPEEQMINEP